jgi:hypothetical protein
MHIASAIAGNYRFDARHKKAKRPKVLSKQNELVA